MDQELARQEVAVAGKMLMESGLIVRTWGNVSCRIDSGCFAITPSGMAYETMRPGDIVIVNTADQSYEGRIKPSSEKGIHARLYQLLPHINFVIHTHQVNASVAAVLGEDVEILDPKNREIIGERAAIAGYGLPGTKKLQKNVAKAVSRFPARALLMANHGALCFGEDCGRAFAAARALEDECGRFLTPPPPPSPGKPAESRRAGQDMIFQESGGEIRVPLSSGSDGLPVEARLHLAVYRARRDVAFILGSSEPSTFRASRECGALKPLLDDFAQIAGVSVAAADCDGEKGPDRLVRALRGRSAVLLKGRGALCCAGSREDAAAVAMVLEKECLAYFAAAARGPVKPISPLECRLMRFVYLSRYAKKARKE
ncbi:MAG: class II aldolase/adducin family protein [Treponema sp.]|jgi:L-fuculose-phosphate aldolase|nr:class II aldolase/adducin family protein [Treponema sp.]